MSRTTSRNYGHQLADVLGLYATLRSQLAQKTAALRCNVGARYLRAP